MQSLRTLLVAALCLMAATGCTGEDTSTTGSRDREVAVYLTRDGKVAPVRRTVDEDGPDAVDATMSLLFMGPTEEEAQAGYGSSVTGDTLAEYAIADGTATLVTNRDARPLSDLAAAQLAHTLRQFPDVGRIVLDGKELSPAAVEDATPQIVVESPLPGDSVRSPFRLRGTANVFEATVSIEVRDESGDVVLETFTTATSGNGTRGTFSKELSLPDTGGNATIVAFESSAEDGRPLHSVEVPVVLTR